MRGPLGDRIPSSDHQRLGDVISVTCAVLDGMRWNHAVATAVEQQARQQARVPQPNAIVAFDRIAGELRLRLFPQHRVDYWLMPSRVRLVLVDDRATVDWVLPGLGH